MVQNGATEQLDVLDEDTSEQEFGYGVINYTVLIAMKQGTFNMNGTNISIPETGIYFISVDGLTYISSLSNITALPFDDKYIPNTIARKAELDSRITEKEVILTSSTSGSTKKFRITVDDTGTIKATEVTNN